MSEWKARRFWKEARVAPEMEGFTVHLDGRPVKTPAKNPLILPTFALAEAVAAEWRTQAAQIDPQTMPFTRSANAAIDKVADQFNEVAGLLAEYGDTDLVCYRATHPERLVRRQTAAWDPLIEWAGRAYGARLTVVAGVVHEPQPPDSLTRLAAPLANMSVFEMTALHDLVMIPGSLVIGLAAAEQWEAPAGLWERSRVDEDWQIEEWGEDDEAAAVAAARKAAFVHAADFFRLSAPIPDTE